jgi:hypothetical protein
VRVASTTGSHFNALSCQGSSPLPMLPDTSNAKARCTGCSSVDIAAVAHAWSPPASPQSIEPPVPPVPPPGANRPLLPPPLAAPVPPVGLSNELGSPAGILASPPCPAQPRAASKSTVSLAGSELNLGSIGAAMRGNARRHPNRSLHDDDYINWTSVRHDSGDLLRRPREAGVGVYDALLGLLEAVDRDLAVRGARARPRARAGPAHWFSCARAAPA